MTDPRTLAHAPDARALAHEILRRDIIPPLCSTRDISNGHSRMCDLITSALRTARKEAYERAAKVADAEWNTSKIMTDGKWGTVGPYIAAAIRKLGDDDV